MPRRIPPPSAPYLASGTGPGKILFLQPQCRDAHLPFRQMLPCRKDDSPTSAISLNRENSSPASTIGPEKWPFGNRENGHSSKCGNFLPLHAPGSRGSNGEAAGGAFLSIHAVAPPACAASCAGNMPGEIFSQMQCRSARLPARQMPLCQKSALKKTCRAAGFFDLLDFSTFRVGTRCLVPARVYLFCCLPSAFARSVRAGLHRRRASSLRRMSAKYAGSGAVKVIHSPVTG